MENSFTAIGISVLTGSAVGGTYGVFDGLRQTKNLEGKLRRTQIVNYTLKSGKQRPHVTLLKVYQFPRSLKSSNVELG